MIKIKTLKRSILAKVIAKFMPKYIISYFHFNYLDRLITIFKLYMKGNYMMM